MKLNGAKLPEVFQNIIVLYKSSLIDSKARQGNEAEVERHRERLSEKTPQGDAIVRSCDIDKTQEADRNVQLRRVIGE